MQVLWLFKHLLKWYDSLKLQEDTVVILPGKKKRIYIYLYMFKEKNKKITHITILMFIYVGKF